MTHKRQIQSANAPIPGEGHPHAIQSGGLIFITGQIGRDPHTGVLMEGLDAQARQTMMNVDAILEAADCTRKDIVEVKFLMADIKYFKRADEIYADWLPARDAIPLPTCTAFVTGDMEAGALIALDVTAASQTIVDQS